jgi:hypothetical protein
VTDILIIAGTSGFLTGATTGAFPSVIKAITVKRI